MKRIFTLLILGFSPLLQAQTFDSSKYLKQILPFPVGASVNPRLLGENTSYRGVVESEFSSLTAENHMKMALIHPESDRFDFTKGDEIVAFAKKNKSRVHGHTLVWHNQTAQWMKDFQGDQQAWENLLKNHIQTIVKHYQGQIAGWDVVNEAFLDDGSLRPSIWADHIPDYLAKCFVWAHEADPQVLLFYNDYGQDGKPKKMEAILNMVQDFKKRQIPIDGLGLQMHISIQSKKEEIKQIIEQSTATGLRIHFSEVDIAVNPKNNPDFVLDDTILQTQSDKFQWLFSSFGAIPRKQQYGITFWNVGDKDSWLRGYFKRPKEYPLLFDENYQRKSAYQELYQRLTKK
ncbi:endo-1,4-beta-xylanase [Aquirufa aurantiipilula]|uniref:Beta-xylanase n=1 Tax=Aquirufa aurantiipilula TaxID=2696561 RepID=A0ABT6BMF5_9BACT|nr:endo-1,4-beta-xylanase [Aquirufa aurantiipilula]MDF5691331.1 endo-1,4-beta-xylanase [Aquirufa aurantiipilula]